MRFFTQTSSSLIPNTSQIPEMRFLSDATKEDDLDHVMFEKMPKSDKFKAGKQSKAMERQIASNLYFVVIR